MIKSTFPLVLITLYMLVSPLLTAQDLEVVDFQRTDNINPEEVINKEKARLDSPWIAEYYRSSRKQILKKSLIPLPFGTRIFYDGINNNIADECIFFLEGAALIIASAAAGTLVEGFGTAFIIGYLGLVGGIGLTVSGKIGLGLGLTLGGMQSLALSVVLGGSLKEIEIEIKELKQSSDYDSNELKRLEEGKRSLTSELLATLFVSFTAIYLLNIIDAMIIEVEQEYTPGQYRSASLEIAPVYDVATSGIGLGMQLRF